MKVTDPQDPAVQALTAYWLRHPQASDTLDGICRWWVAVPPFTRSQVEAALAWLVMRGLVQAHQAADGRVRYRRVVDAPA